MKLNTAFFAFIFLLATPALSQPRRFSLDHAITAALENNAAIQLAEEREIQARARSDESRAGLMPNVTGSFGHSDQTVNLGARGFRFPGIPSIVGPFGITDARLQFGEPVLDLALVRRYQAARRGAESSSMDTDAVRQTVAASVARLYFDVQRARAMIDAIRAQIALDESLRGLATQRKEAGVGTALDVTRAESRLAADRHRLIELQNEMRSAEFRLLRAMGESLGQEIELSDALGVSNSPVQAVDGALVTALANRPEWKSQERKLAAATLLTGAARAERLPKIQAFGDFGDSGSFNYFLPSRTVGLQLSVPLFDGGRRAAIHRTAASQLRQEEIRTRDLRSEIEMDIRMALDRLASAREQVRAAAQSLALAEQELELSRLRFEAQVTTQIDVLNAQAELAAARSRQVTALFVLKIAEVEYSRATGTVVR